MLKFHSLIRTMRCHYLKGGANRLLAKLIYRYVRLVYHCDIPYQACIDGVYFCHKGFGTVINPHARIGEGTIVQHGVSIGEIDGSHASHVIGKNCFIGAHALVLGDISIGDNVKIGAGSVVIKDVPANCTAVGVPARVITTDR